MNMVQPLNKEVEHGGAAAAGYDDDEESLDDDELIVQMQVLWTDLVAMMMTTMITMAFLEHIDDSEHELLHMTEAHMILLQEMMDEISMILESEFTNIFSIFHNFSFIKNTLMAIQKIISFLCHFRIPFPDEVRFFLQGVKVSNLKLLWLAYGQDAKQG